VACYCMLRRYWILGAAAAMSIGLVAGCGTAPRNKPAPQGAKASTAINRERADERSVQRRAEAHAHYAAGVIREMNDDQKGALDEYCQAAMLDPDDESLILEVSRRLLQSKQPERALEIVKCATARPGASGQLYARLGLIYSQLGKNEQAAAANREAIKKSPGSLAGYQNLYLGYLRNKQPREALNVLDEAARQLGADSDFLIGLAELYLSVGAQAPAEKESARAKALATLNRAAKLGPMTPLLRLKLADGFNLLGESDKAAQLYLEVLKQLPEVPMVDERVRANLTAIYLRASDHKRATEQLQGILRDDPTNPQVHYYLGRLALEDKKPAEAADHLSKTILLSPELETAYYFLALAQIDLDKGSEALATLEKARRKFPQSFAMEFYTALAYSRQKSYAEALKHFVAAEVIAKATDPSQLNEGFYFQLGATCERKGDYAGAEQYFQKSLQLVPDFAEALNYLGYMWAEHGMKLDQARQLIEKAVKAQPKNAAYLDSMAWVLFKLNQPAEALPYALKAVELTEQPDATVYDHIGDIYAALKQPEKAREFWRKSLALEPSEEIRKKLDAAGAK
jgi:tetratricopeptide (TPR) repeat protein